MFYTSRKRKQLSKRPSESSGTISSLNSGNGSPSSSLHGECHCTLSSGEDQPGTQNILIPSATLIKPKFTSCFRLLLKKFCLTWFQQTQGDRGWRLSAPYLMPTQVQPIANLTWWFTHKSLDVHEKMLNFLVFVVRSKVIM